MPCIKGSKYHRYGGRYTMGRGIDIPGVGGSQYTMGRGVDIPWVVGSICHG